MYLRGKKYQHTQPQIDSNDTNFLFWKYYEMFPAYKKYLLHVKNNIINTHTLTN